MTLYRKIIFYWKLLKESIVNFIEDDLLTHAAAISYYTVFSLPSMLLIVLWTAAQFYKEDVVNAAIFEKIIGLLISNNQIIDLYDAAGSLLVLMLWVYYASIIFLFGATFTFSYAKQEGIKKIPNKTK